MNHNLVWFKSTKSNPSGNCVEVAHLPAGGTAVRHSKMPAEAVLRFTDAEWAAFLEGAKAGEFDLPER